MRGNGPVRRRGYAKATASFLLGAVVGSIAAILTAPASGPVTRRRLLLRVRTAERKIARRFGRAKTELMHRVENTRDAANEWIAGHMANSHARRTNGHGRRPLRRRVAHQHA